MVSVDWIVFSQWLVFSKFWLENYDSSIYKEFFMEKMAQIRQIFSPKSQDCYDDVF